MEISLRRAGFWRRVGAVVIDSLAVMLPLQLLVALAFIVTDGAVQGSFGVAMTTCAPVTLTVEQRQALRPPPPDNANAAVRCEVGFLGLTMARTLSVLRQETRTTEGGGQITSTTGVGYSLNGAGDVVAATDMGLPALLVLLAALVAQWALFGRSIGGRLLQLRVVATPTPDRVGLGWGRALVRVLVLLTTQYGLLLPGLAVAFALLNRGVDVYLASFWGWPAALLFGGGVAQIGVLIWLAIDIARRRDPLYDRWSRTAVLVD